MEESREACRKNKQKFPLEWEFLLNLEIQSFRIKSKRLSEGSFRGDRSHLAFCNEIATLPSVARNDNVIGLSACVMAVILMKSLLMDARDYGRMSQTSTLCGQSPKEERSGKCL
jgi:hypothetical protein